MTTDGTDRLASLPATVRQLLSARALDGAALPPGARSTLEQAVTRLLVETPTRDRYVAAWREELRRSPLPAELRRQLEDVDVPGETLCRDGVGVLSDRELVALAARPHTLELLAEFIIDSIGTSDLGKVWERPLDRAARDAYPETSPEVMNRLVELAKAQPAYAKAVPSSSEVAARNYSRATLLATAAATLLLGAGIGAGGFALFSGRGAADGWASLSSDSAVAHLQPRGGDVTFELRLGSPRPGFAAVIVPRPGDKPRVYPESWGDPPRVGPGAAKTYGPLDARAGQTVLVVVAETPAADVLRRAFEKAPPADSLDAIRELAEAALKDAGFRWAAFARVELK